jgi:hypothetical protein
MEECSHWVVVDRRLACGFTPPARACASRACLKKPSAGHTRSFFLVLPGFFLVLPGSSWFFLDLRGRTAERAAWARRVWSGNGEGVICFAPRLLCSWLLGEGAGGELSFTYIWTPADIQEGTSPQS